ncbi:hypothetical protein [Dendronalium sp. ChiSLP03b]|uniref:hypothetical protein n=1 Tax=Dendronalium sp. ChiSLP03b TaxID=3075381 RepID=UPI002ADA1190|nr:hypothetical protein [Dendronalium sp. ChiSLP03b]
MLQQGATVVLGFPKWNKWRGNPPTLRERFQRTGSQSPDATFFNGGNPRTEVAPEGNPPTLVTLVRVASPLGRRLALRYAMATSLCSADSPQRTGSFIASVQKLGVSCQ